MRIDPLGESALILRDLPLPVSRAADLLTGIEGVVEAWAAFDTVGVVVNGELPGTVLQEALTPTTQTITGRSHTIPVLYDGEDLAEVAARCGLARDEAIALHAREYECRAVGFCPGFAYLAPLAPELAALPRRDSPRSRVAPGSVAIAAGMTAVYPLERPGGWWIVGRTPLVLVDEEDGYFPIRAGDRVAFHAIDEEEFERQRGGRLPMGVPFL